MPKVSIYTQVHNAGVWLDQCVSSVLSQTYTDFEYILVDSCSTDGSAEKVQAYAEKDPRIKAILLPENILGIKFKIVKEYASGTYLATLDHDDWWEPNFLERLVPFAEKYDLDLAITGVSQYFEESHASRVMRHLKQPIVMTVQQFAKAYAQIGVFAGAWWASIMRTRLLIASIDDIIKTRKQNIVWRSDTIGMLKCIEHCSKLGIDNSILQHYRMHSGSQIQQYNDLYFDSCVIFCEVLEEFLLKYEALDAQMEEYLKKRFLVELRSPLNVMDNSSLPDTQKVQVCARIAEHPRTRQAMSVNCPEGIEVCKRISTIVMKAIRGGQLANGDVIPVKQALQMAAPDCIGVITADSFMVFAREPLLLQALLRNDKEYLTDRLLQMLEDEQDPVQTLGAMLHGLIPKDSPLYLVSDARFWVEYTDVSRFILKGGYLVALDRMTELLLSGTDLCDEEAFLQIYLTLAALRGQVPAFVFGKISLAKLYLKTQSLEKCAAILTELEEMGTGEHREVVALRQAVEKMSGGEFE